jgi:hypothetical protein
MRLGGLETTEPAPASIDAVVERIQRSLLFRRHMSGDAQVSRSKPAAGRVLSTLNRLPRRSAFDLLGRS